MEYKGYMLGTVNTGLVEIKPIGKGSVVKGLRGLYTTKKWAMKTIDAHLASKEKSNGKAESTG